jgi:hypothetical protein
MLEGEDHMEKKGTGVLMFTWVMFTVLGIWNIIQGLLAVFRSSAWVSTYGDVHRITLWNVKTWGWLIIIWGIIELLAAASIWRGAQFGRWLGLIIAGLGIIGWFLFLPQAPFWSILMIALYAWVLHGLAVYGGTHEGLSE